MRRHVALAKGFGHDSRLAAEEGEGSEARRKGQVTGRKVGELNKRDSLLVRMACKSPFKESEVQFGLGLSSLSRRVNLHVKEPNPGVDGQEAADQLTQQTRAKISSFLSSMGIKSGLWPIVISVLPRGERLIAAWGQRQPNAVMQVHCHS